MGNPIVVVVNLCQLERVRGHPDLNIWSAIPDHKFCMSLARMFLLRKYHKGILIWLLLSLAWRRRHCHHWLLIPTVKWQVVSVHLHFREEMTVGDFCWWGFSKKWSLPQRLKCLDHSHSWILCVVRWRSRGSVIPDVKTFCSHQHWVSLGFSVPTFLSMNYWQIFHSFAWLQRRWGYLVDRGTRSHQNHNWPGEKEEQPSYKSQIQ